MYDPLIRKCVQKFPVTPANVDGYDWVTGIPGG